MIYKKHGFIRYQMSIVLEKIILKFLNRIDLENVNISSYEKKRLIKLKYLMDFRRVAIKWNRLYNEKKFLQDIANLMGIQQFLLDDKTISL